MRFHKDRDKRFHPIGSYQIVPPEPRYGKFVMRRPGAPSQRGFKRQSQRPEGQSQLDGIADDSPMIAECYQAHLDMAKMLTVLAELRGDATEDAISR